MLLSVPAERPEAGLSLWPCWTLGSSASRQESGQPRTSSISLSHLHQTAHDHCLQIMKYSINNDKIQDQNTMKYHHYLPIIYFVWRYIKLSVHISDYH